MGRFYEIVSIQPAEPPSGAKGSYWYRYVIALDGNNSINGYRQGNIRVVTKAVENIVAQLNERHFTKRGDAERAWR
jgi:hypothetical protein